MAAGLSLSQMSRLSGAGVDGWADALPQLVNETELQKMLADEKMRSEQHKINYQTLKTEHTRLQDEYLVLQQELKSTIEEVKVVHEKYKTQLEQLRKDLASLLAQNEELRANTLTEQKKELLVLQIKEEVERPFHQKVSAMNQELEQFQSLYNKLKYEYSFLKSEYEHEKQECVRIIQEMKMRHEAEVSNLRKERETIIARQQNEIPGESQRVRLLQRENAQLNLKVKGLLTELEEIRAQREHQGLQSDHVSRMQSKQLAEHQANLKSLETERESLKLQCENLQKEVASMSDLYNQLTSRVHELEKDNVMLKNRAEEISHKSKVEITNLKMEMLRERGDLERDRDKLKNEVEELQTQIEILKHQIDYQSAALVDKERQCVKQIQAAREEEWQKLHAVENDKMELETKIQEMERRKIDEETARQAEKEKMEDRIQAALEAKESAEKEALVARTKLQHQEALLEQLERERAENSNLKVKLHRLETEYNSYVTNESELLEMNSQLKMQVDSMSQELRKARDELGRSRDIREKEISEYRKEWAEEKLNLQSRLEELKQQLCQSQVKVAQLSNSIKKKKKKYLKVATKLKDRVSLLQAKLEEAQIERDTLKKSVPPEVHLKMKKQLNDILRRHRDFRSLLKAADLGTVAIGDLSFASAIPPGLNTSFANIDFVDNERHQKDLDLLKERLDLLDDHQKAQLDEFRDFARVSTPTNEVKDCSPRELDLSTDEKDEGREKDMIR